MKAFLEKTQDYIRDHKKDVITGLSVALVIIFIVLGLALYSYNTRQPRVVFEPAPACALFTLDEAKSLLGKDTINGVAIEPEQRGNVADSKCSYSDGKTDTENAAVIAVIIRSGINDRGVEANKDGFSVGERVVMAESVSGLGDQAFFDAEKGQLNILKETTWIIISYGQGADTSANRLDDAKKVAELVLKQE